MDAPSGYRIEPVEPADVSDRELASAVRLRQVLDAEARPDDPPTSAEAIATRMRLRQASQWRRFFVARDSTGAVVGYGVVGRDLRDSENEHMRWSEIAVHPAHRRRGLGRALLAELVDAVADQGDGLFFIGQATDAVPAGEAFARAVGGAPGLGMKLNQLDLRAVDRAKVAEWARIDPPGYRLERADGTVPEDMVRPYIEAANGMNDAPRGDLRMGDWHLTEEHIRDREKWVREAGVEWWLIVAVHEATGQGAGFTDVAYDPRMPHVIQQRGTAVTDEHRGHGIGLWMKAAMLERILAERPAAVFVRTGNAHDNAPMLRINTQLGFRHAWSETLWQASLADVKSALRATPSPATR